MLIFLYYLLSGKRKNNMINLSVLLVELKFVADKEIIMVFNRIYITFD